MQLYVNGGIAGVVYMNSLKYVAFLCLVSLSISSEAQIFKALRSFNEIEFGLGPNIYNIHYEENPTDQIL